MATILVDEMVGNVNTKSDRESPSTNSSRPLGSEFVVSLKGDS